MAGMLRRRGNIGGETESVAPVEPSSEFARRRRMAIHQFRFAASDGAVAPPLESGRRKRRWIEAVAPMSPPQLRENAVVQLSKVHKTELLENKKSIEPHLAAEPSKFGMTSICGRRRDMEDAVAIHPSLFQINHENSDDLHFFGVYDGHGCSHVATKCKDRMHEIVKEELERCVSQWEGMMKRSFSRMDKEITDWSSTAGESTSACRCELRTPLCDAVGSTAVVALVTSAKIVVSNCGDSRAVLCRKGKAIALSLDHKADRPDEMNRIQEAGGRIIYLDGPRVQGFLAMSRAIGDSYLKPYVISDPEVTVTDRTEDDDCLILATDGLWDVVSNDTACRVARMCLRARHTSTPPRSPRNDGAMTDDGESSDKACSDASVLLTKLALARHSSDNISVVVVDLRRNLC